MSSSTTRNIHLTGHAMFCRPTEQRHLCLIHPLRFGAEVLSRRNLIERRRAEQAGELFTPVELGGVHVFRGQPSNSREPRSYARTQAQRAEWTRDQRVRVHYRPLKYYDTGAVREKGIDVLVALSLVVEAARTGPGDLTILAAHDTDQEPALELAHRLTRGRVETAGWEGANVLRVPGKPMWHTRLGLQAFARSRDRRLYL